MLAVTVHRVKSLPELLATLYANFSLSNDGADDGAAVFIVVSIAAKGGWK